MPPLWLSRDKTCLVSTELVPDWIEADEKKRLLTAVLKAIAQPIQKLDCSIVLKVEY